MYGLKINIVPKIDIEINSDEDKITKENNIFVTEPILFVRTLIKSLLFLST